MACITPQVNYTFYITKQGNDTITHRIDFNTGPNGPQGTVQRCPAGHPSEPGVWLQDGSILYGDFQVQHDLEAFRKTFMPPAECLKPNVLACNDEDVEKWDRKYFTRN